MTVIQWELAHRTHTLKALILFISRLILFNEILNVANEEKFTILGGTLFQTFTTC